MAVLRMVLTMLVAAGACALTAGDSAAYEPETIVAVAGGREYRGVVDESSTAARLVLRSRANGITLLRPIGWGRIAAATVDGRQVTVEELRTIVREGSGFGVQGSGNSPPVSGGRGIELRDKVAVPLPGSELVETVGPLPHVTTLAFDPYIANWDADVETDGLVVEIAPLDSSGGLVAASGTLEVELFAAQRRTFHHAPLSGGDTFELVERWSRAVNAADFSPRGVQVRLPYGAIHPELRPDWMAGWYGLVHVKLSLPGYGVFEDSRDGVRIRPWSPNRDQLELNTGRRFLPTERLGRFD